MPLTTFVYLIISTKGTSHEHHHRSPGDSFSIMNAALGGEPERIPTSDATLALWCGEEGSARSLDPNPAGSRLVCLLGGREFTMAGGLLVTGYGDQSNPRSLTETQVETVLRYLRDCR